MPTPIAGVKPLIGNRKPVALVKIVVSRNSAVKAGIRCEPSIPSNTITPLAIAIRLMTTCNWVNA